MCDESDKRRSALQETVQTILKDFSWALYIIVIYGVLMFIFAAVKILTLLH